MAGFRSALHIPLGIGAPAGGVTLNPTTGNAAYTGYPPSVLIIEPVVERPPKRRSPWVKPVREGYGTVEGVEGHGYVGKSKAHGYQPPFEGVPGVAPVTGEHSVSEVGRVVVSGAGHAKSKILRPVRGSLGEVLAHAGGHVGVVGCEAVSEYETPVARGKAVARTYTRATPAEVGKVLAQGVQNLPDPVVAVLSLVLQRRRNRRRK